MAKKGKAHPEESAFRAAMNVRPDAVRWEYIDRTVLGVFADWLDDRGDPRGPGYRLLYESGHSPWYSPGLDAWAWWRTTVADQHPMLCDLRPELFYALRGYSRYDAVTARAGAEMLVAKYYRSRAAAFAALARVVARRRRSD